MANNEIIIFPNHRVETGSSGGDMDTVGKDLWMVRPLRDFLVEVKSVGGNPSLAAATLPFIPSSRNNAQVTEVEGFRFFPLGGSVIRHPSLLRKSTGYMVAMFQLMFRIPKKPCWYIFFPDPMSALVCLVCCILRIPYGLYVRCNWKTSGWLGLLYQYYFRNAAFIIATGEAFRQRLLESNEMVQEVAPMTNFKSAEIHAKQCYDIQGEAVILFVGQLHPKKGVLELVQAVAQVGRHHKVRLVIVGESSGIPGMPGKLEATIRECNCHQQVEMVGQIRDKDELARRFEEADLLALPTYYPEGFPRVVYEAMCFGLPVLCTDVEGRQGFLRDGENCRYVKMRSAEDLAVKLTELLEDKTLRSRIGNNGAQDVRELLARFDGITHGMQVVRAVESGPFG